MLATVGRPEYSLDRIEWATDCARDAMACAEHEGWGDPLEARVRLRRLEAVERAAWQLFHRHGPAVAEVLGQVASTGDVNRLTLDELDTASMVLFRPGEVPVDVYDVT